ncbi:MAG: porin [Pirellulaceae bacterium]|nr:porin [Pirellulaceae bacterium]
MSSHSTQFKQFGLYAFRIGFKGVAASIALMLSLSPITAQEAIESRLAQLEFELSELRHNAAIRPTAQPEKIDFIPPTVSSEKPAEPKKVFPAMKMTGFFQLDSVWFNQSANNRATLGDIQDGAGFRRARLAATGDLTEDTSYMFELDIAQFQALFVDVWGQFNKTPMGNIRIGRFRQPFGMTEMTSIRDTPMMERPSMFALSPFRQTGIMFSDTALDQRATWAMSGFRTISDNYGNVYGDDGGYGTATRLTWLPIDCGDERLVHLGFDYSYLDPARDQLQIASQNEVLVSQNPNFGPGALDRSPVAPFNNAVFVPPFVNAGLFDVNHVNLFNFEAAASLGRTTIQSEFRWGQYSLPGAGSVTAPAFYVVGRHMLTGETIPYKRTNGVFVRPVPLNPVNWCNGHFGAWEVNSQISRLDLTDFFGQPGVTGPGRSLLNYTSGLVWYLNSHAKIHSQWIHSLLEDPVRGQSQANTFAGMAQFDF